MHQTVGDALQTHLHGHAVNDEDELNAIVDAALATAGGASPIADLLAPPAHNVTPPPPPIPYH